MNIFSVEFILFLYKYRMIIYLILGLICNIISGPKSLCSPSLGQIISQVTELKSIMDTFENSTLDVEVYKNLSNSLHELAQITPTQDTFYKMHSLDAKMLDKNVDDFLSQPFIEYQFPDKFLINDQGVLVYRSISDEAQISPNSNVSISSCEAEIPARPNTPDTEQLVSDFREDFFQFSQIIKAFQESKNSEIIKIPLEVYIMVLKKSFDNLDKKNLSGLQQLTVVASFAKQPSNLSTKKIMVKLPDGSDFDVAPYTLELFRVYREIFHKSPSSMGLVVRGGVVAASKIGFVSSPQIPDLRMPTTVRFTAISIYRQLSRLASKITPSGDGS